MVLEEGEEDGDTAQHRDSGADAVGGLRSRAPVDIDKQVEDVAGVRGREREETLQVLRGDVLREEDREKGEQRGRGYQLQETTASRPTSISASLTVASAAADSGCWTRVVAPWSHFSRSSGAQCSKQLRTTGSSSGRLITTPDPSGTWLKSENAGLSAWTTGEGNPSCGGVRSWSQRSEVKQRMSGSGMTPEWGVSRDWDERRRQGGPGEWARWRR